MSDQNDVLSLLDDSLSCIVKDELKFKSLTPVQQAAIPLFLSNADVAVEAPTGSGKTLAYLLPTFQMLVKSESTGGSRPMYWKSIVMSPTRELAQQIYSVANLFASTVKAKMALFTGGTPMSKDLDTVKNNALDLIICTPGRMEHLMNRLGPTLNFSNFQVLILDEADLLLEYGFETSVNRILDRLPKQRRTGLFSATQTNEVKALIRAGLRNPSIISIQVEQKEDGKQQKIPTSLECFHLECEQTEKLQLLVQFLNLYKEKKVLTFFATCASVRFFHRLLANLVPGLPMLGLYGQMKQSQRNKVYDKFVKSKNGVLLSTDVAARGLDIPKLDWVVCFDPPDAQMFVHRIGRTARAGRKGRALVFVLPKESAFVNLLENKKVPIREYPEEEKRKLNLSEAPAMLERAKQEIYKDRDLLEKGTKAFISFLRSYKEHNCQYIFRMQDLDLNKVAQSFLLLRLPNIKEFRETKGLKSFTQENIERVNAIPFKEKHREKQRQQNYAKAKEEAVQKKKDRLEKRRKRKQQDESEVFAKNRDKEKKKKRKSKQKEIYKEWEQLADEERLYKKLKKKKITQAEYDAFLFTTTN